MTNSLGENYLAVFFHVTGGNRLSSNKCHRCIELLALRFLLLTNGIGCLTRTKLICLTNMKPLALLTLLLIIMSGSAVGQTLKSNLTGYIGKDVLLSCTCSNDRKELIWQKGERVVNAHTQDNITVDEHFVGRTQLFINKEKRNCSLLLRHISTTDAGVYTCYAIEYVDAGIYLTESTEVNLIVDSMPETSGRTEEKSVTAVSVSVPIAVVFILAALLLILLMRRQHRTNRDTDLPAEKPMLQNV
ncbi:uncharacterized protein LOC132095387 isoform X2 [Carassius carassius]|uniref:uncharacterized protein LOC132095387 isoform X2 n=1 Tax=Carassius carassius TaxID=217509 RepID=UPI002869701E|nr:uncharacterized protein LOC132095387 isoform X2 [Carassius carassius]